MNKSNLITYCKRLVFFFFFFFFFDFNTLAGIFQS